jgi:hypothetical protein
MGSQTSEVRLREGDQDGDTDCVPAPEPMGAGSLPPGRCAGHQSVRKMGSVELPVL